MAEVNVQRRQQERERGLERRSQGRGLWGGSPADLFALSPFTLMRRLTEDMDRMFSGYGGGQTQEIGAFMPPVEVREEDKNLIVSAELPGLNKDDIRVEIQNDSLVLQGAAHGRAGAGAAGVLGLVRARRRGLVLAHRGVVAHVRAQLLRVLRRLPLVAAG